MLTSNSNTPPIRDHTPSPHSTSTPPVPPPSSNRPTRLSADGAQPPAHTLTAHRSTASLSGMAQHTTAQYMNQCHAASAPRTEPLSAAQRNRLSALLDNPCILYSKTATSLNRFTIQEFSLPRLALLQQLIHSLEMTGHRIKDIYLTGSAKEWALNQTSSAVDEAPLDLPDVDRDIYIQLETDGTALTMDQATEQLERELCELLPIAPDKASTLYGARTMTQACGSTLQLLKLGKNDTDIAIGYTPPNFLSVGNADCISLKGFLRDLSIGHCRIVALLPRGQIEEARQKKVIDLGQHPDGSSRASWDKYRGIGKLITKGETFNDAETARALYATLYHHIDQGGALALKARLNSLPSPVFLHMLLDYHHQITRRTEIGPHDTLPSKTHLIFLNILLGGLYNNATDYSGALTPYQDHFKECNSTDFIEKAERLKTLLVLETLLNPSNTIKPQCENRPNRYTIGFSASPTEPLYFAYDDTPATHALSGTDAPPHNRIDHTEQATYETLLHNLAPKVAADSERCYLDAQLLGLERSTDYIRSILQNQKAPPSPTPPIETAPTEPTASSKKSKSKRKANRAKKGSKQSTKQGHQRTTQRASQPTTASTPNPHFHLRWDNGSMPLWEAHSDCRIPTTLPAPPIEVNLLGQRTTLNFGSAEQDELLQLIEDEFQGKGDTLLAGGAAVMALNTQKSLQVPFQISKKEGFSLLTEHALLMEGAVTYQGGIKLIKNRKGHLRDIRLTGNGQLIWPERNLTLSGHFEAQGRATINRCRGTEPPPQHLTLDWPSFIKDPITAHFSGTLHYEKNAERYHGAFDLVPTHAKHAPLNATQTDGASATSFRWVPSKGQLHSLIDERQETEITRIDPKGDRPGYTLLTERTFDNGTFSITLIEPRDPERMPSLLEYKLILQAPQDQQITMSATRNVEEHIELDRLFVSRDFVSFSKNARIRCAPEYKGTTNRSSERKHSNTEPNFKFRIPEKDDECLSFQIRRDQDKITRSSKINESNRIALHSGFIIERKSASIGQRLTHKKTTYMSNVGQLIALILEATTPNNVQVANLVLEGHFPKSETTPTRIDSGSLHICQPKKLHYHSNALPSITLTFEGSTPSPILDHEAIDTQVQESKPEHLPLTEQITQAIIGLNHESGDAAIGATSEAGVGNASSQDDLFSGFGRSYEWRRHSQGAYLMLQTHRHESPSDAVHPPKRPRIAFQMAFPTQRTLQNSTIPIALVIETSADEALERNDASPSLLPIAKLVLKADSDTSRWQFKLSSNPIDVEPNDPAALNVEIGRSNTKPNVSVVKIEKGPTTFVHIVDQPLSDLLHQHRSTLSPDEITAILTLQTAAEQFSHFMQDIEPVLSTTTEILDSRLEQWLSPPLPNILIPSSS